MKHKNGWVDVFVGVMLLSLMFIFAACAEPHLNKETNKIGVRYGVLW